MKPSRPQRLRPAAPVSPFVGMPGNDRRVAALLAALESRLPLDPLPELTAPALATWLRRHHWTHAGFCGAAKAGAPAGRPDDPLTTPEPAVTGARQLWRHPLGEGEVALPTRGPVPAEALTLVCVLTGKSRWAIYLETLDAY